MCGVAIRIEIMKTVFFLTFGCKVNHYETECMKSAFESSGYTAVKEYKNADVVVINSCTVTSSGDNRVLTALRKIRTALPDAVIALTGSLVTISLLSEIVPYFSLNTPRTINTNA